MSNLFTGKAPEDGKDCVFVGVHALAWKPEWGYPTVIFNRLADEDEVTEAFADLEHDQQLLILELAREKLQTLFDPEVTMESVLDDVSIPFARTTYEYLTTFMEDEHE